MTNDSPLKLSTAVLKDAAGRPVRVRAVRADRTNSSRRPLRLTFVLSDRELAMELSHREAVKLAEWLDDTVTRTT